MDQFIAIAIALEAGIAIGTALGRATLARELRRMARFIRERTPGGNARVTLASSAPALRELADAVNGELDRAAQAHLDGERRRQEFQRDFSALSHDIRTPLTGAKGYLQLALDEQDEAARARRLAAAMARIDSTTALLDQLFAYTKASDPDLTLDRAPVAVTPLVETVLLGHFPAFEARGWEPQLDAEASVEAEADRAALTRIVENLVSNALRHGTQAPTVTVRAGSLAVANRVADPSAVDTARLFDRFYQADAARGGGGAGLGLATSAQLARAMSMALAAHMEGDVLTITLSW